MVDIVLEKIVIYKFKDGEEPDPLRKTLGDVRTLAGTEVRFVKGNSNQKVGHIHQAFIGRNELFADIIIETSAPELVIGEEKNQVIIKIKA